MQNVKPFYIILLIYLFSCGDQGLEKNIDTIGSINHEVDFRYQPRDWQTCYGLVDDLFKSMIDSRGRLWYDFTYGNHIGFPYDNFCYERNKGYMLGIYPQLVNSFLLSDVKQKLRSPGEPIIYTTGSHDDILYSQTTFASFSDETSALDTRYDVTSIELKNKKNTTTSAAIRLEFNSIHQLELSADKKRAYTVKYTGEKILLASFPEPVQRFAGHISKMKYAYYLDFKEHILEPNDIHEFAFIIHRSSGMDNINMPLDTENELKKVKSYWNSLKLPYNYIKVPDQGIQSLLASCVRNIYQAREIKDGIPTFQVGPTFYRGTWAVDGPFFMEAMTYLGQEEDVRKYIEGIFEVGETQGDAGESFSKQAGLRLWMIWRHAELTGDYEWLDQMWSKVVNEVENIKRYRANSFNDGNPLTNGMMPVGNADGGIGGHYAEYTNNYWVLSGLQMAIQAAQKIGKESELHEWQALFEDYFSVFDQARERDKLLDDFGNEYVPTFMGHETLNPTTGQWAFLHSIFPGKLYADNDSLMRSTLAMLDSSLVEGLILGTGWLPRGLWTYSASFHGHAHLWLGNGQRIPQIIYDFANHASPLLCWSEEQHPVDYQGDYLAHGDMPHNWASVDFIRLIRHSLILERDDELHFFEGLPRAWLQPGMVTRLKDIATAYGIVSFTLEVTDTGNKASLNMTIDTSDHQPPARLVIDNSSFDQDSEKIVLDFKEEFNLEIGISENQ